MGVVKDDSTPSNCFHPLLPPSPSLTIFRLLPPAGGRWPLQRLPCSRGLAAADAAWLHIASPPRGEVGSLPRRPARHQTFSTEWEENGIVGTQSPTRLNWKLFSPRPVLCGLS